MIGSDTSYEMASIMVKQFLIAMIQENETDLITKALKAVDWETVNPNAAIHFVFPIDINASVIRSLVKMCPIPIQAVVETKQRFKDRVRAFWKSL